jgi:hypothetical protein
MKETKHEKLKITSSSRATCIGTIKAGKELGFVVTKEIRRNFWTRRFTAEMTRTQEPEPTLAQYCDSIANADVEPPSERKANENL